MTDLKNTKAGIEILSEVFRLAGDDPHVKAAAGELGKATLTVTKTINNVLLPLAAVNFAFDKARRYFADEFENDLSERVKDIPGEDIIEPKASIAGPALQALAFSHEDNDLKDLYLELLACSMDRRKASIAHPAFVECIRQLQPLEADLLGAYLRYEVFPIGSLIRESRSDGSKITLARHVLNLYEKGGEPALIENLAALVDNWIRLGLVAVDYTKRLDDIRYYDYLIQRPEMTGYTHKPASMEFQLEWKKGMLFPTDYGKLFARAVGLRQ
jgi:hypothetical protein